MLSNIHHPGNERGTSIVAKRVGFVALQDMGFEKEGK
jgi:hypothetical protein